MTGILIAMFWGYLVGKYSHLLIPKILKMFGKKKAIPFTEQEKDALNNLIDGLDDSKQSIWNIKTYIK